MKAIVDPDTCIGCTLCVQICPEVYRMEDDKAVAFVDSVPAELEKKAGEAADECPVDAIRVEEYVKQ